jgi:hypothetical protein
MTLSNYRRIERIFVRGDWINGSDFGRENKAENRGR